MKFKAYSLTINLSVAVNLVSHDLFLTVDVIMTVSYRYVFGLRNVIKPE